MVRSATPASPATSSPRPYRAPSAPPAAKQAPHSDPDACSERARVLVLRHGWNTTAHQALDGRLRRWFSAAGDGLVAYSEHASVRLVAGAPVAPLERLAAVAAEFEAAAARAGKRVCYFGAEERLLRYGDYAAHLIGMHPVWTPATWAERFDGSASLRAQRSRAGNKGVRVHEAPGASERSAAVAACHAAWLAEKRLPALGFLAHTDPNALAPGALADRRLFVATLGQAPGRERPGTVVGYVTAAPIPQRAGWLIDKVVRRRSAPNGTAELLLDTAIRRLAPSAERITLGLAPLALPGRAQERRDAAPAWLHAAEWAARRWGRALYDFEGLQAFKRKFRPDAWEPVYLLTPARRIGVRECVALAAAFLATR